MRTLFSSAYLAPVEYYARWVRSEHPVMDVYEHYQKQTYRSRAYIGGANGPLALNIPIVHPEKGNGHQGMSEAVTATEFRWAQQHFRSLETAYRTSPYFEYYEDRFRQLYFGPDTENLLAFNLNAHRLVCRLLGIDETIAVTDRYEPDPADTLDLRKAFSPKTPSPIAFEPYTQVFDNKFGFQANLSIVDLLFCEGPGALEYLQNLNLTAL